MCLSIDAISTEAPKCIIYENELPLKTVSHLVSSETGNRTWMPFSHSSKLIYATNVIVTFLLVYILC